jgi:hypothetical protein
MNHAQVFNADQLLDNAEGLAEGQFASLHTEEAEATEDSIALTEPEGDLPSTGDESVASLVGGPSMEVANVLEHPQQAPQDNPHYESVESRVPASSQSEHWN